MPSEESTWLIAAPRDGEWEGLEQELFSKLSQQSRSFPRESISEFPIPSFKTGTLDLLVSLSEELPKQDSYFTSVVAKIVDTLRNLVNNDPQKLGQHTLVDEQTVDAYLFDGWKWNEGRYNVQKSLQELVSTLNKELSSIDNVMKAKLNNYNLAKGSLVQMQRKKAGNLSVRSLVDIVTKEHVIDDSEYMETVLVAVPRLIASDNEYALFGVVLFKRVHDDFVQKCRENKFIVRDFAYSDDQQYRQQEELDLADTTEKELWTELLRISRTNFSESFQLLVHLKVVRLFIESVLRYGLPANYTGVVLKPQPKSQRKTLHVLVKHFAYLAPRSNNSRVTKGKPAADEEFLGEYQTLMEQEFFDFVVFDVPWIV